MTKRDDQKFAKNLEDARKLWLDQIAQINGAAINISANVEKLDFIAQTLKVYYDSIRLLVDKFTSEIHKAERRLDAKRTPYVLRSDVPARAMLEKVAERTLINRAMRKKRGK